MTPALPSEPSDKNSGIVAEVAAIAVPLRRRLQEIAPSLTSRWNGVLYPDATLADNAAFNPATGEIRYRPEWADSPLRWRVWLHELLHSYSVGAGNMADSGGRAYAENKGWEEASVEALQRRLRQSVLTEAGVVWDEAAIARYEMTWRFNPYLDSMEELRLIADAPDAIQFYAEMLAVPLAQRHYRYLQRVAQDQGADALRQAVPFAQRLRDDLGRRIFE